MCGILVTIPASNPNIFEQALNTLIHRGPDDFGIKRINNEISMGHRRLSIVDIDHGHQPMDDSKNRYSIVFNGEIYNFIEIKKELESYGFVFKTNSDTEVLLNSYIKWKDNCVMKFNGMWSLAIWDNFKKELFLSRDRFGKKPLLYSEIKGKFIFASEMKAIFPFLERIEISEDFHWMKRNIFLYETTSKCLVKKINRFPKGCNGIYKDGKLKITRYWNTLDHLHEVPKNYNDQVYQFRELLFDACKIRMRSDVPIGTALSGGLDSSAIISSMAYLSKGGIDYGIKDWQQAFIASFPNTPLDETKYAKIIAKNVGVKENIINIDPIKYWKNIFDYFYKFEELYITSPLPMLMTYKAVKEAGVTVTLDGHGADELLIWSFTRGLWDNKFNINATSDILETYLIL